MIQPNASKIVLLARAAFCASLALLNVCLDAAEPPKPGDKAPDFTLNGLDDKAVKLSDLAKTENVVVVVLRGWPGYQCPICDRQVKEFIGFAAAFKEAKARVVMIYPGPAAELKAKAAEFKSWRGREWPAEFVYLLDPDYTMVNAYRLRWDAPNETAYPSTFILDVKGMVRYAKISKGHGGRSSAADVLAELKKITAN